MKSFVWSCCAALLGCSNGLGASVSLECVADTTISEENQAHTSPIDSTMIAGRLTGNGMTSRCRGLVHFDLSAIPSNAIISSATLTVAVTKSHLVGNSDPHAIHRLTLPWTEVGAIWDSTGAEPWNGGQFVVSPDSTVALGDPGSFTFPSNPAMLATVQMWVTNAVSNNGWLLRNQDEVTIGNARRLSSREASSGQPILTVEFTTPAMPPPSPVITSPRTATNQFVFNFFGAAGHSYTVEFKDNLNTSNWTTHVVFPAPAQQTNFTVLDSLNGNRFFRVRAD